MNTLAGVPLTADRCRFDKAFFKAADEGDERDDRALTVPRAQGFDVQAEIPLIPFIRLKKPVVRPARPGRFDARGQYLA